MSAPPRYLKVKVHPDSREDRVERRGPDAWEVWTRAPAERGLANAAVRRAVGAALGVREARLRIVKGATAPSKILQLLGEDRAS